MKKLNLSIVAAGMLVMIGTMESCKKDQTAPLSSQTTTPKSTARELSAAEADLIIQKSNAFVQYADAYLLNPSAQVPGSLPLSFNDADAITYVENGYNFTYGRPDKDLSRSKVDVYTLTINKNASGSVDLNTLVQAYKEGFDHIKSIYAGIPVSEADKRLHTVDVSLISSSASTLSLKLYSIFIFDRVPFTGVFAGITYAPTDEYYISEHPPVGTPGKKGDPTVKFGAPYQIRQAIAANFPYSFGISKTGTGTYLVTRLESAGGYVGGVYLKQLMAQGDYNYGLPSNPSLPTTHEIINVSSNNPWYLRLACVQNHDPFLFGNADYKGCSGYWVPGDALNYSVDGFTTKFSARQIATNKSLWYFGIGLEDLWPSGTTNGTYVMWTPDMYGDVIDPNKLAGGPADSSPGGGLDLY